MAILGPLEWVFIAGLGLALGSFSTALIYRVPQGISWWSFSSRREGSRSRCPHCGEILRIADLVPLFSWAFRRGRCAYCQKGIGYIYPVVELFVLVGTMTVYFIAGPSLSAFAIIAALPFLAALLVIDIRHMILPNQLVAIVGVLAIIYLLFSGLEYEFDVAWQISLMDNAIGAVLYPAIPWGLAKIMGHILKKDALGLGDVKFFAVAGIWLGAAWLPLYMVLAGFMGVLWGIWVRFFYGSTYFPFGPALIFAFIICLLIQVSETAFPVFDIHRESFW